MMKKDGKYGVTITPHRDLTPEETDLVGKTLDMTVSALHFHLKENVITLTPNKNNNSKDH